MIDMGGGFNRQGESLLNHSEYELLDAYVVENNGPGEVRIAVVGACPPGSSTTLRFRDLSSPPVSDELPMQAARLIRRLGAPAALPAGSAKVVGRIDASLSGMTISPAANQAEAQTIVVAHLQYGSLSSPQADANLLSLFQKTQRADLDAFIGGDSQEADGKKNSP